ALAEWVGLPLEKLLHRPVEYHSEFIEAEFPEQSSGALTGLCPPPAALAGVRIRGTLSCLGRDGRLRHRRGEFFPLHPSAEEAGYAVLAVLDSRDLTPEEIAQVVSAADADAL